MFKTSALFLNFLFFFLFHQIYQSFNQEFLDFFKNESFFVDHVLSEKNKGRDSQNRRHRSSWMSPGTFSQMDRWLHIMVWKHWLLGNLEESTTILNMKTQVILLLWTELYPSKLISWGPNPQYNGIWRWVLSEVLGLNEVTREGPSLWN